MRKIVINVCYGGFGLSAIALYNYEKLSGQQVKFVHDIPRDDPILVHIVEELGKEANDSFSQLKIVEIPDDVNWFVQEYDGIEWVAERHRTWN